MAIHAMAIHAMAIHAVKPSEFNSELVSLSISSLGAVIFFLFLQTGNCETLPFKVGMRNEICLALH